MWPSCVNCISDHRLLLHITFRVVFHVWLCHRVSDVKAVVALCYLFKVAPERRFVLASAWWHESAPEGKGSSGMGIFLTIPAFAQEDGVTFLEQEAGSIFRIAEAGEYQQVQHIVLLR